MTSKYNSKEGTQLKCQSNLQAPSQGQHQLVCQIDSIRYPRGFLGNIPSNMPVIDLNKEPTLAPVFEYSSGYASGSPSDNQTKDPYPVPIIN